ncbi:MAG TPA: chemotaxis protein CheB [Candidatus Polarisedimenticolia bacterium]|nr:chemotaxis protein CheB [Candidatus Polarisedimenticolia bacterium]
MRKPRPAGAISRPAPAPGVAPTSVPIVGVGASAGGMEAFASLLKALPEDTGLAFVYIQHLDPDHSSNLSEVLARSTSMRVVEARDGDAVGPNQVYIIPPDADLKIAGGLLRLEPRSLSRHGLHQPIDVFLRSLAEERRSAAIGVVLSGAGADGALGLKAIKAAGGITFAQDEVSAGHSGMPHSARQRGDVALNMKPEEIARELARIGRLPYLSIDAREREDMLAIVEEQEASNELTSSSQELQSTNEELETAREQLQSANEELLTVNEELGKRNLELDHTNNDLSNLLASIQIPIVMLTTDLRIRRVTPGAERALSLIPSDVGRPLSDIRLKLDVPGLEEMIVSSIQEGKVHEMRLQDNRGRWQHLWIRPYRTADDKIDGAVLTLGDIDALMHKEQELERFKYISDNANDAHDLVDREGGLVYVNRRAWERLGYTESEMLKMHLWDIDPLCNRENLRELFTSLERERLAPFESERRRKDGSIFPVEVSVTRIEFDDQPYLFVVARDITDRKQVEEKLHEVHDGLEQRVRERTAELNRALSVLKSEVSERKRAEEALHASELRYRELFEKASDVIYTLDLEGNFTSINAAGEAALGYSREEALRMNLADIAAAEHFAMTLDVDGRKTDGGKTTEQEALLRAKDGRWVPLEVRSRLMYERGRPIGMHCIGRDITERRRIEEERRELAVRLMRSQDEERRRLARELHDTTGQNLVAMRMNLSLVRDRIAKLDPKLQQAISESNELADQCIRELRTLSYLLHPPLLDERGLASAVRLYTEGFSERSGIAVELEVSEDFGRLPQEIELASFRVVQECLTNVHRHSASKLAHIRMSRSDSKVVLEIRAVGDQEPGLTAAAIHDAEERGIGIRGMRERMRQLGGKLEIEAKPTGMVVRAVLPFEAVKSQQGQPSS